jgi:hypothetical protein
MLSGRVLVGSTSEVPSATYPESGTTLQLRAEARNQRGEVVAAGRHPMYRLESAEVARG